MGGVGCVRSRHAEPFHAAGQGFFISAKKIVRPENIVGNFSDFLINSSKFKRKIVMET